MIESLFATLGISKTEATLYLALADAGKAPASVLARNLGLPRSTVYTGLESLVKRGLVIKEELAEAALYSANSVASVKEMVEQEKLQLNQSIATKEAAANELLPLLEVHFKGRNYSIPQLEFFEGRSGIERMLNQYESIWQESIAKYDFTWWGYQDHQFVETYRKWLDRYWAMMKEGEKICLLSNASKTEAKLRSAMPNRTVKIPAADTEFSSTIWVLGDYVVTIMTRQQPHYAFQLKDAVFAANQRMVFQMLWQSVN